jgi:DNA-binding MarR family transcriptional regulator
MARPNSRSTLYRLIEAGQLAHQALLVPLRERGLEPGDDAVLFELARSGTTETALASQLGLPMDALDIRVERLIGRELVTRQAVGPELAPGLALTERGLRIRNLLADNWTQLEEALMGELKDKHRKKFAETLKRFVQLLRL